MQVILGANGIISEGLAKELRANYTQNIKLVSRNPIKVNADDLLFKCDLLNASDVITALLNANIAYLTVGLPYNSEIWMDSWPVIMNNVIASCEINKCKLVYFDNTYGYSIYSKVQTEETPFIPNGN